MNKKILEDIEIPDTLDKAIDCGINKGVNELNKKKSYRRKIISSICVASLAIFITIGYVNPAFAAEIPILGNVFEYIEKNLIYPSNYSQYATSINQIVESNGVKVTLSNVICDGDGLYVTYIVENEKAFKYTTKGDTPLSMNQLLVGTKYSKVDFSKNELDTSGFAGLEGKFIDDKTFVGMKTYYLNSLTEEIPENFDFQTKFTSIGTNSLMDTVEDEEIKGTWAFKVPVKVDKSLRKTIDIDYKEANGYSLDSMTITPFGIVVNSSNPDENSRSNIKILDENNNEIAIKIGRYLDGKNTTRFHCDTKNMKNVKVLMFKENLEENNIQVLLEKTIDIEK